MSIPCGYKILKPGKVPENESYVMAPNGITTCDICGCEFEYTRRRVIEDPQNSYVKCPQPGCRNKVDVPFK